MATTAVVAEILIVGLEAEAWLALVIFMVFGSDWLNVGALGDFEALVTVVAIAIAYVLGIVVDRAADSLFSLVESERPFRWLNRRFGRSSRSLSLPETVGKMRMRVLKDGGPIGGFLDYQRSRLRIVRGSALNLLVGVVVTVAYFGRQHEWTNAAVVGASFLGLLVVCLPGAERIKSAYLERLVDAYTIVAKPKKKGKKAISVVAAVPYQQREDGLYLLLVRTSGGRMWTFPKGHIEADESPSAAAAREADEEAGVKGRIDTEPFTRYRYRSRDGEDEVAAYLLEVPEAAELWPKESARRPGWVPVTKARKRLRRRREEQYAAEHTRVVDDVERALRTPARH